MRKYVLLVLVVGLLGLSVLPTGRSNPRLRYSCGRTQPVRVVHFLTKQAVSEPCG